MPYTNTEPRLPFASGSHTSHRAAVKQARNPRRGVKVMMALLAYQRAGEAGLTDPELVDATGLLLQSVCSIRHQLMEDGLVGKGGERPGRFGMPVTVWFYIAPSGA